MNDEIQALSERIERLEGQNRRTKMLVGGVTFVLAVLLVLGQAASDKPPTPQIVTAEMFRLTTPDGKLCGLWASHAVAGHLLGKENWPVVLGEKVEPSDATLMMLDKDRKTIVTIGTFGGEGVITVRDGKRPRLVAKVENGLPSLRLIDRTGTVRATLGATSTTSVRSGLEHKHPESSLLLFDKEGNVLFEAPKP